MNRLNQVIKMVQAGLYVYPIVPNGKQPIKNYSYLKVTQDIAEIESWFEHEPNINIGLNLAKSNMIVVDIDNFDVKEFIENGPKRCYYCKKVVFSKVKEIAKENNIKYVVDGTNLDDLGDYRPGLKAIEELNVVSPLKECGFTKNDIRALSKEMNLNTFNKPAFACLATRIPCGTKITNEKLRMIEKSEEYLVELGFNQFRVRLHEDIARIEVGKEEIHKFFSNDLLDKTNNKLKEFGFKYVTLDMGGYKMGSTNLT